MKQLGGAPWLKAVQNGKKLVRLYQLSYRFLIFLLPLVLNGCSNGPAKITSFSPSSSFFLGGGTLSISGTNFRERMSSVTIGGLPCTNINRVSSTLVTCTIPSHSSGVVDLVIADADNVSTTFSSGFTYRDFSRVDTIAGAADTAGNTNGTGAAARFSSALNGLAISGSTLYVADGVNYQIRKVDLSSLDTNSIDPSAVTVSVLAGKGTAGGTDGDVSTAEFYQPDGLAIVGDYLFVTDSDWTVVAPASFRKVDRTTGVTTTIAATTAYLGALAYDGAGYFYSPEVGTPGNRIYKISSTDGSKTAIAGGAGTGTTDGVGAAARFNGPYGIAFDSSMKNLYVVDQVNHLIRKVEVSTSNVTTFAGGSAGSANGTGTSATFDTPSKNIIVGDYMFISDWQNCSVRQIKISTSEVTTVAGVSGDCSSTDGDLGSARFRRVNDIAYSPDYGIFVVTTNWGFNPTSDADNVIRLIH